MNIIERLKNNKEAFGLMDKELQEIAKKVDRAFFYRYGIGVDGPSWLSGHGSGKFSDRHVFRLRSDYICSHREKSNDPDNKWATCSWCSAVIAPEKPKTRWAEHPVSRIGKELLYKFKAPDGNIWALHKAFGMIRFGGIRYIGCECYDDLSGCWITDGPPMCEKHGPFTPVSVRFWEEVPAP